MGRLQFNPKRKKCWQLIGWSGKIEASLSFEVCSSSSWRWSGTTLSFEHLEILRCWWGWSGLICCCWGQPSPRIFFAPGWGHLDRWSCDTRDETKIIGGNSCCPLKRSTSVGWVSTSRVKLRWLRHTSTSSESSECMPSLVNGAQSHAFVAWTHKSELTFWTVNADKRGKNRKPGKYIQSKKAEGCMANTFYHTCE